jgi:hypothetical protein
VGTPLELALDAVGLHEARDLGDAGLVGLPVGPGALLVEPLGQLGVGEAVQRGDLRRGVAGGAGADGPGVDDDHGPPRLHQQPSGGQAGDPGPEDDDVGLLVRREGREVTGLGRGDPEGGVAFMEGSHGPPLPVPPDELQRRRGTGER